MTKDELRAQFRAAAEAAQGPEKSSGTETAPALRRGEGARKDSQSRTSRVRPNKFRGVCAHCGAWVDVGKGVLGDRDRDGKYQIFHLGACPTADEAARNVPGNPPPQGEAKVPQMAVWPGKYTLEDPGDGGGHITLRVRQQPEDADFAPGETLVGYLSGPDNQADYTQFAFLSRRGRLSVWKKHRGNGEEPRYVKAARHLVADPGDFLVSRHCFNCNAELTTPESVELGFGPECRKKFGL